MFWNRSPEFFLSCRTETISTKEQLPFSRLPSPRYLGRSQSLPPWDSDLSGVGTRVLKAVWWFYGAARCENHWLACFLKSLLDLTQIPYIKSWGTRIRAMNQPVVDWDIVQQVRLTDGWWQSGEKCLVYSE